MARITDTSPSWVCRWRKPRAARGRDGQVPDRYHRRLLEAARDRSIPQDRTVPLTARELIYGLPDSRGRDDALSSRHDENQTANPPA